MAQGFLSTYPPNTGETFANFPSKARTNQSAINTIHSGTSAPTSPETHQLWLDTSAATPVWKIYDGTVWKLLEEFVGIFKELKDARGSAATLDARLAAALNEDGTLKAATTLSPSEWQNITGTTAKTSTTIFTITGGDRTAIFHAKRRVKMTPGPNYGTVASSSHAGGTTTVTITETTVPDAISAVDTAIITSTAASTAYNATSMPSPSGGQVEDYLAEVVTARNGFANLNTRVARKDRTPYNLLQNGGMEFWSAGASAAPNAWTLTGTGATIAREGTTIKRGTYSAKPNTDGTNNAILTQNVFDAYFKARTVTVGCWLNAAAATRIRLRLDDGVGTTDSAYHTGGAGWEWISVTRTLDAAATKLEVQIRLESGVAIAAYADGAMLVEGNEAYSFAPGQNDFREAHSNMYDAGTGSLAWTPSMLDGNVQKRIVNATGTLVTPSNAVAGMTLILILKQDGTGSRVITWPTNFHFPGGTEPLLSTAANAIDVWSGVYDGTNWLGALSKDHKA